MPLGRRRLASKSPHKLEEEELPMDKSTDEMPSPKSNGSFPMFRLASDTKMKRMSVRPPETTSDSPRLWNHMTTPVKTGYLSKLSTGKWKRRHWHERWFVLTSNGALHYFKYEQRPDGHQTPQDSFMLHESGALLTIQVDLPRGTPTPFCFAITVLGETLLVCANTEKEFREWTNAISTAINPKKTESATTPPLEWKSGTSPESIGSHDLDGGWSDWLRWPRAMGLLVGVNTTVGLLRYGNWYFVVLTVISMNLVLLWLLTSRKQKKAVTTTTEDLTASPPPPSKAVAGTINGTRAVAGCSMKECKVEPYEAGCWTQLAATRFNVRKGPNYRRTKAKAPSENALLTLIATDAYRSDTKIDNIGKVVQLPDLPNERRDILIINCQVPCYTPSNPLWGEQKTDGDGFNFVTYFAIPPNVRDKMNETNPAEPAIKLFKAFLQDDSPIRDRLKAIGVVVNPTEQNLGRMEKHLLETYNGQPILTRPQHRFYRGDGYFEVDIDAHIFNFVARKGLCGVADHFGNMVVDFGFVLEGQEDDELPEQILGCVRLCKVDLKNAPRLA
ncbi:hypothetical protein Ae201684P_018293 [Aphanomyces euteiches]|uniref:PH domain-containing protein n=1 Tax=Aphanomyces euteiches TaxID=100861 RepID=A0A6G0XV68_9STRA|nr:hypothetical protein Ae201684_000863 [Aphanomyces euteiches]KAH9099276.1 hypothetical protein Ae201684P_018293 [Aphanomyces euteiches]